MLTSFTNPTICDVRGDLAPFQNYHSYCVVNKFFGQPDDGLHTGPKHVVLYYILLLIVILLCSWLYVYIDTYKLQLCIIEVTEE